MMTARRRRDDIYPRHSRRPDGQKGFSLSFLRDLCRGYLICASIYSYMFICIVYFWPILQKKVGVRGFSGVDADDVSP